jgi:hypothetical protein
LTCEKQTAEEELVHLFFFFLLGAVSLGGKFMKFVMMAALFCADCVKHAESQVQFEGKKREKKTFADYSYDC